MLENDQDSKKLLQMDADKNLPAENPLRPRNLNDFIGQGAGKRNLQTFISSASATHVIYI